MGLHRHRIAHHLPLCLGYIVNQAKQQLSGSSEHRDVIVQNHGAQSLRKVSLEDLQQRRCAKGAACQPSQVYIFPARRGQSPFHAGKGQ